jgi:hypothetical protein
VSLPTKISSTITSKTTMFALIAVASVAVLIPNSHGVADAATSGPTMSIAIQRLGASWSAASGYTRYPTVIVDRANAAAAAALPSTTRVLVYHAGVDVNVNWNAGVSYADALANGWLLKDSAGNLIHNAGYPDNYIADIGNPSYQQRWASDVAAFISSVGADGVYIDDVLGDPALLTGNVWPAKYPTHQSWNDAMASFIAYVGPYMKSHGLYIAVNAKNFIPGDAGSNDGSNDVTWWQRLAPNVNGLLSEYWQQNPNSVSQSFSDCACSWLGWWSKWQRLETTAQAAGDDFFSLIYGAGTDARTIRYEKASFLMDWNGKGGGMIWNPTDTGDPWNADWTQDIGTPTAARYQVGVGWRRSFTNGTALINTSSTSSQSFALGASYVMSDGSVTSNVTLAPMTAMTLSSSSSVTLPVNVTPPAVAGTPQAGQQLSASAGSWTPTIDSYGYQWSRCDSSGASCSAVSGATSSNYMTTSTDVGHTVRVTVAATDSAGTTSALSPASSVVSSVSTAPTNSALPVVTGTPQDGKQLASSTGSWAGTVSSYAYQWYRCDSTGGNCASLLGATAATYGVGSADVGSTLRSKVFATGPGGTASATSAATAVVSPAPPPPAPPANTALPVVSGTTTAGQQLTVSNGSWSTAITSYAYAWSRCDTAGAACVAIQGASSLGYQLGTADVGYTIRAKVTATGAGGSTPASSVATAVIAPAPAPPPPSALPVNTAAPQISGSPVSGKTVTAQAGSWSGSPTTITFQWLRCSSSGSCSAIAGATGTTYQLAGPDSGSSIRVSVTATNAAGSATASSATFGPVHGSKN